MLFLIHTCWNETLHSVIILAPVETIHTAVRRLNKCNTTGYHLLIVVNADFQIENILLYTQFMFAFQISCDAPISCLHMHIVKNRCLREVLVLYFTDFEG